MTAKKVIGLDFGTLSARGVLIGLEDGELYGQAAYTYPHGVMDKQLPSGKVLPDGTALAHPDDYMEALTHCIRQLVEQSSPDEIVGIGIDATTYSMVPCQKNGQVMCSLAEYANEPMAYIKLWKHHGAQEQAHRIQQVHMQTGGIPAIERCGGRVNCEWALPKLLETYEAAPSMAKQVFRFCDLGEWLVWQLTGKPVNSVYSQSFKCMWAQDLGGPSEKALEMLLPGFSGVVREKLLGQPSTYESPCGVLRPDIARKLSLKPETVVAAPIGDGCAPGLYFCRAYPNALAISYSQ